MQRAATLEQGGSGHRRVRAAAQRGLATAQTTPWFRTVGVTAWLILAWPVFSPLLCCSRRWLPRSPSRWRSPRCWLRCWCRSPIASSGGGSLGGWAPPSCSSRAWPSSWRSWRSWRSSSAGWSARATRSGPSSTARCSRPTPRPPAPPRARAGWATSRRALSTCSCTGCWGPCSARRVVWSWAVCSPCSCCCSCSRTGPRSPDGRPATSPCRRSSGATSSRTRCWPSVATPWV